MFHVFRDAIAGNASVWVNRNIVAQENSHRVVIGSLPSGPQCFSATAQPEKQIIQKIAAITRRMQKRASSRLWRKVMR